MADKSGSAPLSLDPVFEILYDWTEVEDEETERAADLSGDQLKEYWTRGPGLAKWKASPHPWTTLKNHLVKYVGAGSAARIASQWFKEVFGYWPGERKGTNPVGKG